MNLPDAFLTRMRAQLGDDFPRYLAAMEEPAKAALRVNTLKISPAAFAETSQIDLAPLSDADDGFSVPAAFRPGQDPLHAAGLYYMQEPSAQAPVRQFAIEPDMAVLDVCAAPGGKSAQLAARMQGTGVLLANEYVAARAAVLCGNLERMGVTNAVVTNMDTHTLCATLAGRFDAVLCDAPCAGEGMFRKDARAVAEWSPAHVEACALRERGILDDAALAVKSGGQLIYSTCSFSPAEDEETTARFLERHPDFSLQSEQKLYPHTSDGEGQYLAHFVRTGTRTPSGFLLQPSDRCASWEGFQKELSPLSGAIRRLKDGRVLCIPPLPFPTDKLKLVRAGLLLGEDKSSRFEPSHALAMAAPKTPFLHTESLSEAEALRYLHGETISRAAPKGWCAATYRGFVLGLLKSDGSTLKNHYPKGLRLLS